MELFDFLKQKRIYIVGCIIFCLALFVRFFHVGDWLHYELDQARDFRIIHAAIEYGPGDLPLQGPKAAGNVVIPDENGNLTDKTTLRLGPLFYYIEYVSALLFGATPLGAVILIVILSTLTVPLFYVFARRFFTQSIALGLSAIMASSLFFVTYSRFGWNPNLMPFFMLLFGYSLLRVTDIHSTWRGWWLVSAACALAFVGHMHFLAFIAAPLIGIAYLLWSWKRLVGPHRIALRFWCMACVLFVFLQAPLIINDIKTHGENTKAFIAALTQKSSKDTHTLPEKIIRNIGNHAKYYWIIVTGDQRAELPTIKGHDIKCDQVCRDGLARGGVALIMIIAGIVAWALLYQRETDTRRRDFLRLTILWAGIVFALYIPLAYAMAPRFFLLHGVVALIFFGFVVQLRFESAHRYSRAIGYAIIILSVISNLIYIAQDFAQRARAATDEHLRIQTDYILKEKTRMPFEQMVAIVDYIAQRHKETGMPVWLHGQPEFKRALWERLDTAGVPRFSAPVDLKHAFKHGLYFVVIRSQSDHDAYLRKVKENADILQRRTFGTLTLYELVPHSDVAIAKKPEIYVKQRDPHFSSSAQKRYLWRQIFENK